MIHYDLRCGGGHAFDGWFRDSATFDQQAARGLVECPVCGGTSVERALMAPRLSRGAKGPVIEAEPKPNAADASAPAAGADAPAGPPMPIHANA